MARAHGAWASPARLEWYRNGQPANHGFLVKASARFWGIFEAPSGLARGACRYVARLGGADCNECILR